MPRAHLEVVGVVEVMEGAATAVDMVVVMVEETVVAAIMVVEGMEEEMTVAMVVVAVEDHTRADTRHHRALDTASWSKTFHRESPGKI